MSSYLDYPFHLDLRGCSAETCDDDHVRDLIHQVLFTSPGERVNRPDFGCGLKQLVFMPNSDVLTSATRSLVQGALQRWLELLIRVDSVTVDVSGEHLVVTVVYTRRATGTRCEDRFTCAGPA